MKPAHRRFYAIVHSEKICNGTRALFHDAAGDTFERRAIQAHVSVQNNPNFQPGAPLVSRSSIAIVGSRMRLLGQTLSTILISAQIPAASQGQMLDEWKAAVSEVNSTEPA